MTKIVTLEKDGHDPQTYRFKNEDERLKAEQEVFGISSVNGDLHKFEKVGSVMKERNPVDDQLNDEFVISDQSVQKKLTEESVPYVVQVGEQEEDLDYDLKNENNSSSECTGPGKKVQNMVGESIKSEENQKGSAAVTQQISENRKNLWISNLPKLVKAADLKQHFSRAGKVVSATVVMSTRTPGGCFGSIQMASAEDAATAVSIYDSTEFGGCILRVEATERKAPIQSNNLNDRISGLNKVKASNLPDSQRMTSKSMVSRKRYIDGRNCAALQ
ncbi:unnamed protein product [Heterobilharzia americana]|nr:unnamed protein product [Heterobilharzia americana]